MCKGSRRTLTTTIGSGLRTTSTDPSLHNIPRGNAIKRFFQVPRDRYFIEVDYSQAELRVLAVLSGDEFLKRVYVEGRDLHDEVSLAMFGPNYTEEQRVKAKAINFGKIGRAHV